MNSSNTAVLNQTEQKNLPSQPSPVIQPKFKFTLAGIKWPIAFFMIVIHLGAIGALFTFSWQALAVCLVLHWITGGVGITLGYHRLFTHRSFRVPKFVEYILAVLGSLACQGGPLSWVAAHRLHHIKSDHEGDPHSPLHGFFWSHMGWCVTRNKELDGFENSARQVPDMKNDPIHVFIDRSHILWTFLLGAGLYGWGGWPFVFWGVFLRMVLVYHCTWFVNSAAHVWGYQTYKSNDESKNLWWVALLTYGEGWHNNHHAFQYSARHGLKWWEFDSTYLTIRIMELLGIAKAVKLPSASILQSGSLKP